VAYKGRSESPVFGKFPLDLKARLFKEIYERIPRYLLFMAIYLSFFLLLEMGKAHIN
jgi:hypothetical protein